MVRHPSATFTRRQVLKVAAAGSGALALSTLQSASSLRVAPFVVNAQVSGEIEFAYYNWGPSSIEYFKRMAAAFEQSHPGTKIQLTLPPTDQYATKLKVLLATGKGPDIITTTDLTLRLFKEGRLLDLTDRLQQNPMFFDPNAFIQGGWDIYRFGTDRIYGIYSGADTLLLYYNKTLFDKAGISYPTSDWTWDNFVEAAKALTIREGDRVTQWGTVLGSFDAYWGWANLVWMEGGDIIDSRPFYTKLTLNNEPVIKVLRFLHDLVYTHQVAPTPSQAQSVAEQGGFQSGKVAMVVDGGWSIQSWKDVTSFAWDIEMLPKGSAGFVGEFWPGTPFQINAATENPDLAWEYVSWFSGSKEAQELIAKELIQVPALFEVSRGIFLEQPGLPDNAQAWVRSLENTRPGDMFHEKQQELMDKVWTPNWEKFQRNSISAEEFAKTVEEDGNALLQSS